MYLITLLEDGMNNMLIPPLGSLVVTSCSQLPVYGVACFSVVFLCLNPLYISWFNFSLLTLVLQFQVSVDCQDHILYVFSLLLEALPYRSGLSYPWNILYKKVLSDFLYKQSWWIWEWLQTSGYISLTLYGWHFKLNRSLQWVMYYNSGYSWPIST